MYPPLSLVAVPWLAAYIYLVDLNDPVQQIGLLSISCHRDVDAMHHAPNRGATDTLVT